MRNLAHYFKSFKIKPILRGKNVRSDSLNKLASTSFNQLTKKVLVEVLMERSIDNKQNDTIAAPPIGPRPILTTFTWGPPR